MCPVFCHGLEKINALVCISYLYSTTKALCWFLPSFCGWWSPSPPMLQSVRSAFKHHLIVVLRSPSAKKLTQHSSFSEPRSRINSRMHLILHGAKLTMLQQSLLLPITRAFVMYSTIYTWVGDYSVWSIQSPVFGTHFAGRNLRKWIKKTVSLLICIICIFMT
jgi:hypothetical protein